MIQILLHSSKTMRLPIEQTPPLDTPTYIEQAVELVDIFRGTTPEILASLMKISDKKAAAVQQLYHNWSHTARQTPAVDAFVGDIYSGLQVSTWTDHDRTYAHEHLMILSGLYGGLRACDGIAPYRLEMGYKLPDGTSLYDFWGARISDILPQATDLIINLSAVEYTKAILPHVNLPVITPKFLTVSPKTNEPTFVTVHAKIARGAFARWLIQQRIEDTARLAEFNDLGYCYDASLSSSNEPVFVCQQFQGLGLSVRLTRHNTNTRSPGGV